MNFKPTYPAFTLWELMIAMLITTLIVSLSYGVYWKFTQLLDQDMKHSELMQDLRLLEREIYRLTQSSQTITQEGDQLVFEFVNGYSILEFTDSTLIIEYPNELIKEFPIEKWTSEYLNDQTEHIRSFQISCRVNLQIYTLTFKKSYPQSFLYSMQEL